jgi:hypothetical protein
MYSGFLEPRSAENMRSICYSSVKDLFVIESSFYIVIHLLFFILDILDESLI